jgi:hypothetical protein
MSANTGADAYRRELLRLLDEAYRGPAWHGASLRGALRGVDPGEALWTPPGGGNSIWALLLHAAYARHVVRGRVAPDTRDTFPVALDRPWWPKIVLGERDALSRAWRRDLALLDDQHRRLTEVVRALPGAALVRAGRGRQAPPGQQISGVALHDTYHTGQIKLLRAMRKRAGVNSDIGCGAART